MLGWSSLKRLTGAIATAKSKNIYNIRWHAIVIQMRCDLNYSRNGELLLQLKQNKNQRQSPLTIVRGCSIQSTHSRVSPKFDWYSSPCNKKHNHSVVNKLSPYSYIIYIGITIVINLQGLKSAQPCPRIRGYHRNLIVVQGPATNI